MGRAWECALQLKQKQQNTSQEILTLSISEALLQILLYYTWSSKDKMVWSHVAPASSGISLEMTNLPLAPRPIESETCILTKSSEDSDTHIRV